jgi:molybdopterin synthase catalytic subunit
MSKPMTKNTSNDWLAIRPDSLPLADVTAFVSSPQAGGVDIFLGVTRSETHADGRALVALDYEAYTAMAEQQLHDLAKRARDRWPIVKLVLLHRVGRVALGEASVIIAVSTPHRAEAFDACRWIIDTLKKEVTLWKKEIWTDGSATWLGA